MIAQKEKQNYRIPLFSFVTMLYWFSMYTYVPILAAYVEHLGASHKMAGIIVGSYGFTQMLLRVPIGVLSDKMHKRKLFIEFGLLFALLSGIGLWLSKDLTLILIFRALAGAAAATWVDFTVLFTSYYKHNESTRAIGTISFYNSIAQMTAMFIGGWAAEQIGWEAPFIIGAIGGIVGLAASFFIVDKYEESAAPITMKGVLQVIGDKTLLSVSFLAILSQLITFATVFGFTPVYATNLGADKFQMSLLTVFSSLPTAIASLIGGRHLTRKYGEKAVVIFGFALTGIFTLIVPFTSSFWVLILTQVLSGFGRGLSFPALMGLSIKDTPSDKRATAMGFFQAIYGLGMFIGPTAMGFIGDIMNLRQGFMFIGVIGCATAVLSGIFIQQKRDA